MAERKGELWGQGSRESTAGQSQLAPWVAPGTVCATQGLRSLSGAPDVNIRGKWVLLLSWGLSAPVCEMGKASLQDPLFLNLKTKRRVSSLFLAAV